MDRIERLKLFGVLGLLILALGLMINSSETVNQKETGPFANVAATMESHDLIPINERPEAPDFLLPEVGAPRSFRLSEQANVRPVVFSFWATWCGPCQVELPYINKLSQKYKGRIAFYGVNSNDEPQSITKYTRAKGLKLTMLSDEKMIAASNYTGGSIPTLVLVDRKGRISYIAHGLDMSLATFLPQMLDKLAAEG